MTIMIKGIVLEEIWWQKLGHCFPWDFQFAKIAVQDLYFSRVSNKIRFWLFKKDPHVKNSFC